MDIIGALSTSNFLNETDVREDFVSPLLKALGYSIRHLLNLLVVG